MQRAALPQALPRDNQGRWAGSQPAWTGQGATDVHQWGRLASTWAPGPHGLDVRKGHHEDRPEPACPGDSGWALRVTR